jgi:hypothetical protein
MLNRINANGQFVNRNIIYHYGMRNICFELL